MPTVPRQEQTRTRPACPLYGFHYAMGVFLDSKGNQCPLRDGYAPCLMEMKSEQPNWQQCPLYQEGKLEGFAHATVFPNEAEKLSFPDWVNHIFSTKLLPSK